MVLAGDDHAAWSADVAKRSGTTQAEARAKLGLKVQRTVRRDRWFIDLSPQPRKSS